LAVRPEDVLVLASDGVAGFELDTEQWSNLATAAVRIVQLNRIPSDDAVLLAARISQIREA
jgi:hypothetical protein